MEDGEALDPNEHVLRRVHKTQVRSDGSLTRGAFTPNAEDIDGISVYREESNGGVNPLRLRQGARKPADEYIVVRLPVHFFQSLALQVVTKSVREGLPGHCVVPDFNYQAYQDKIQKEARWIKVQDTLCESAIRVE